MYIFKTFKDGLNNQATITISWFSDTCYWLWSPINTAHHIFKLKWSRFVRCPFATGEEPDASNLFDRELARTGQWASMGVCVCVFVVGGGLLPQSTATALAASHVWGSVWAVFRSRFQMPDANWSFRTWLLELLVVLGLVTGWSSGHEGLRQEGEVGGWPMGVMCWALSFCRSHFPPYIVSCIFDPFRQRKWERHLALSFAYPYL